MEFGRHLGKGVWGIADKALPVVYGVGFVVLVVRVLPEQELGNFVLLQELFLVISGLGTALALQPLLKFASEEKEDHSGDLSAALVLNLAFLVPSGLLCVLLREPAAAVLNAPAFSTLLLAMPGLLATSFIRNVALTLLQSRLRMKALFLTDAAHFLGFPFLIWVLSRRGTFDSAGDLVRINLVTFTASSMLGAWFARGSFRVRRRGFGDELRRAWDYGRFSLAGVVSYLFFSRADAFVLSAFTGPVQVAVYTSAKIFVRIYEMVTQVVQMFVLPVSSRLASRGETAALRTVVEKAIAFTTVGILPVMALFLFGAPQLLDAVYRGRYAEAAPLLQAFALLTLIVPAQAVASNVLLGLGQAREGFVIGAQTLLLGLVSYFLLVPWLGAFGAALGYVVTALALAWLSMRVMVRTLPLTVAGVAGRTRDITNFLRSRLRRP